MLISLMRLEGTLRDKWPIVFSILLCSGVVWFAYGCQPQTKSLICPENKVNRAELNLEIDTLLKTSQLRIADLDKQEQIRQIVFKQALVIADDGQINPVGLLTSLLAIFGIGATADDVRLRKQRKKILSYEPVKPNVS